MRPRSLRSKIFSFVFFLLVVGAGIVMLIAQHDVTKTVTINEERAVDNVLTLLAHDSEARWGSLLDQKVATIGRARQPLIEYGNLIRSVLELYRQQAQSGLMPLDEAQRQALEWVKQLELGPERLALILDSDVRVLVDNQELLLGSSLADMRDIKGRRFGDVSHQELGSEHYSFVIYRSSPDGTASDSELRYAALARFPAWDWIIALSDSAQPLVEQLDQQQASMQSAVSQTVASIKLAGDGFVFILDEDGQQITPLDSRQNALLHSQHTPGNGRTLLAMLQDHGPSPAGQFVFKPADLPQNNWLVKTTYVKPLKWTIVTAVPSQALAHAATALRNRIGLLFLGGLALALMLTWALSARITKPLQQLGDFARRLPEDDLTLQRRLPAHIESLPQRHRDEVGDLAAAFIYMNAQLREKVSNLLIETSRRERFESELNIARDIQLGLLPERPPAQALEYVDVHARMIAAKEVGGDLFDYFLLDDGRLCFAIGDVSDKGMPAALFMAVTRTLLRACAEGAANPGQLMERINNRLTINNPNMMFVTLIIGILDLPSGNLSWANAGHPALYVRAPDGELSELAERSGPACGVQADVSYHWHNTRLNPHEMLIGYTDGITEAMNVNQQFYGENRLRACIAKEDNAVPSAAALAQQIINDVQAFAAGNEQSDDITLIVLKNAPL